MTTPLHAFYAILELVFLYSTARGFGYILSHVPKAIMVCYRKINKDNSSDSETVTAPLLPDFLGMLIAGVFLANIPGDLLRHIPDLWSACIRKAALTVILARAGLNLDVEALRKRGTITLRLASMPCLAEATIAAFVTRLFRPETSWGFCFCLGFILAAVSPAVVVPSLLTLQDAGYGVDKGIPTLILAAASLDDVLAICGFGVAIDIAFAKLEGGSQSNVVWIAMKAPISIIGGLAVGYITGYMQYYVWRINWSVAIPRICTENSSSRFSTESRAAMFLVISLAVVFVASTYGFDAGGYLTVMVSGFVVATAAKGDDEGNAALAKGAAEVSNGFKILWGYIMPALFMLIGAQVNLSDISQGDFSTAVYVLLIAVTLRVAVTLFAVSPGSKLSTLESIFIAVAWFPKATVQAALGSAVLDRAYNLNVQDDGDSDAESDAKNAGRLILTAAVLAILVTAPIGSIGIFACGPRWLHRSENNAHNIYKGSTRVVRDDSNSQLDVGEGTDLDEEYVALQIEKHEERNIL